MYEVLVCTFFTHKLTCTGDEVCPARRIPPKKQHSNGKFDSWLIGDSSIALWEWPRNEVFIASIHTLADEWSFSLSWDKQPNLKQ